MHKSIENISSFPDHHLQPIAQKVNSFIKDTNHFLRKIKGLGQLPEGAILCTIDVVGIYPNIPHEEGLASLRRFLDARTEKKETTETLVELAEIVLKNNIFQLNEKTFCHSYHCKKSIFYSQAFRYNRICSDNEKFDQRCNDLEKWLMERL